jgi:RNA polymerase sigma-70 factor (ECF subfamily)
MEAVVIEETPLPEPSDATLVARAKAGDVDAFGRLYRRYVESIYRYLFVRVRNEQDAEDLTEVVFLRSFQALGRYRERGWPFSAFLYQVAMNVLVDHYRQRKGEEQLSAAEHREIPSHQLDDGVIRSAEAAAARQAMADLPVDYQEVIRLRVLLGMPTPSVAAWMGRSQGAVRVLLFRALRFHRHRLDDEREG